MRLQLEEVCMGVLAGVEGFEPSHDGIKTRCLTAWLHPNNVNFLSAMFYGISDYGKNIIAIDQQRENGLCP